MATYLPSLLDNLALLSANDHLVHGRRALRRVKYRVHVGVPRRIGYYRVLTFSIKYR